MRTQIFQHGGAVHRYQIAGPESFGRIGRRQPIALAWMAAGGHGSDREAIAVDDRQCPLELHAAARADRSHRIGGLVALSLRPVANWARRLIAEASSNFLFFQPKE
jgi:hypothetical protein